MGCSLFVRSPLSTAESRGHGLIPIRRKVRVGAALTPIQGGDGGHLIAAEPYLERSQVGGQILPFGRAGITVMPWASSQASDTWAAETPWRLPISISSGSASTLPWASGI